MYESNSIWIIVFENAPKIRGRMGVGENEHKNAIQSYDTDIKPNHAIQASKQTMWESNDPYIRLNIIEKRTLCLHVNPLLRQKFNHSLYPW